MSLAACAGGAAPRGVACPAGSGVQFGGDAQMGVGTDGAIAATELVIGASISPGGGCSGVVFGSGDD